MPQTRQEHGATTASRRSKLEKIMKWGAVILGMCAVALTIESCVNRTSKNEDAWQRDYGDRR